MTKVEILEILNVKASQVVVNNQIYKRYGSILVDDREYRLHLKWEFFLKVVDALDGVIVTFDPKWNNNDSDYLEGRFTYELAGQKFLIFALFPKTKEEK